MERTVEPAPILLLSTGLEETIKWSFRSICSTARTSPGLQSAFQSHLHLVFRPSLKDQQQRLVNAQEGKTQQHAPVALLFCRRSRRAVGEDPIWRSPSGTKRAGDQTAPEKAAGTIPPELKQAGQPTWVLKASSQLSHGRKRTMPGYIREHEQAETKASRLEKIIPMILVGKGLNDKQATVLRLDSYWCFVHRGTTLRHRYLVHRTQPRQLLSNVRRVADKYQR